MLERSAAPRSRSGDRQEDLRQALALTAGVLTRHRPALATIAGVLMGKAGPGTEALTRRLAADPACGPALRQLVDAHSRAAHIVNQHQQAFNAALTRERPAERALYLNAIPLAAIVQAGEQFMALLQRWQPDRDVGPLLRGARPAGEPGPLQRAATARLAERAPAVPAPPAGLAPRPAPAK
ncbi:MAG: hypothetical protein JWM80_2673, partial [Cyanobacteria bacterium RYN_339]|nr:hypothetical protein [Cyanobacteria bacterium RYN_339]